MTIRRALIRALDRPGGRWILSPVFTRIARTRAPQVRVYFHRGLWVHEQEGVAFVDSPVADYHPSTFRHWPNELERRSAAAVDHWLYAYRPQPGDAIVDAGAGKGEDTLAFARAVGPNGRVLAIEAHPVTFGCLELFCRMNRLDQVRALNYAIVDRTGPVFIGTAADWQANRLGTATGNAVSVPGITLDALVEREALRRIDLLKMNIEGAEALAVRGMERTFRITRALCISCHDFLAGSSEGDSLRTKGAVQEAVERAGFRIVSRDGDPRRYVADQVNAVRLDAGL